MQNEILLLLMPILIDVIDAGGVELRRAALDAVYPIAFLQQEFGKIGAVLAGHAGNQRYFRQAWSPVGFARARV